MTNNALIRLLAASKALGILAVVSTYLNQPVVGWCLIIVDGSLLVFIVACALQRMRFENA